MTYRILILGASYGSLLGTKLALAGHDVTLVCRDRTARLINEQGTEVRIRLKGDSAHRSFLSGDLAGRTDAVTPGEARPEGHDLICLAMQEPQYSDPTLRDLMARISQARAPCMSIMNMPPLPYLGRIPSLERSGLEGAYRDPGIWAGFDPALMTLCSPDPQAFRPPGEAPNILNVGLPTNFKVSKFGDARFDAMLSDLENDIEACRVDGREIPVKLRVFDSPFVPFAKWAMLATGNYRCITADEPRSIRDAVHADPDLSRGIYDFVNDLVVGLGADREDMVPFEKYADVAQSLLKPSSAARAVADGATDIERVDKLVQLCGNTLAMAHPAIDQTVRFVDAKLAANRAARESRPSRQGSPV
jgi:hypothetical protein